MGAFMLRPSGGSQWVGGSPVIWKAQESSQNIPEQPLGPRDSLGVLEILRLHKDSLQLVVISCSWVLLWFGVPFFGALNAGVGLLGLVSHAPPSRLTGCVFDLKKSNQKQSYSWL